MISEVCHKVTSLGFETASGPIHWHTFDLINLVSRDAVT